LGWGGVGWNVMKGLGWAGELRWGEGRRGGKGVVVWLCGVGRLGGEGGVVVVERWGREVVGWCGGVR
jgi:hypothetical protein